jgi:hypothetical protein
MPAEQVMQVYGVGGVAVERVTEGVHLHRIQEVVGLTIRTTLPVFFSVST